LSVFSCLTSSTSQAHENENKNENTGVNMRSFGNYILGVCAKLAIVPDNAGSYAEDADREQLLRQLVKSQQRDGAETIETQFAPMVMLRAKQVNPNVGLDKWLAIQGDVNAAVASLVAQGGGVIETMTRAGAANLSDTELIHLVSIYRDPVLAKYTSAVSNPVIQAQVQQASIATGLRVSTLINSILERNGLQGVH
jgi:hypothetical protein